MDVVFDLIPAPAPEPTPTREAGHRVIDLRDDALAVPRWGTGGRYAQTLEATGGRYTQAPPPPRLKRHGDAVPGETILPTLPVRRFRWPLADGLSARH